MHAVRSERAGAGEISREDARLGVDGLRELLRGAGEALRARAGAHGVGHLEDGAGSGLACDEVRAHARVLGSLTREEKG